MPYEFSRYVVVGFCVNVENSVHYSKANGIEECEKHIKKAFLEKGADFVSVRRIR